MAKLLIADDDQQLLSALRDWLESDQYTVEAVEDGTEAQFRLSTFEYDAIILDWEMPGVEGPEVCKDYRARGGAAPVILLTGRDDVHDKIKGLNIGADDYITKPFHPEELSARLKAVMRRPKAINKEVITFGTLEIDATAKSIRYRDQVVTVQPREFELLLFLARHPGQVFNARALMERIWSSESETSPDVIRVHVTKLRGKLGNSDVIKNLHGSGYKFDPDAV